MVDDEKKTEELDLRKGDSQSKDARPARDERVRVLPTDDYVAVSPFTPLSQAIEAMKSDEGGCVIISDDGRVAGIFTERDLLQPLLAFFGTGKLERRAHQPTRLLLLFLGQFVHDVLEFVVAAPLHLLLVAEH